MLPPGAGEGGPVLGAQLLLLVCIFPGHRACPALLVLTFCRRASSAQKPYGTRTMFSLGPSPDPARLLVPARAWAWCWEPQTGDRPSLTPVEGLGVPSLFREPASSFPPATFLPVSSFHVALRFTLSWGPGPSAKPFLLIPAPQCQSLQGPGCSLSCGHSVGCCVSIS